MPTVKDIWVGASADLIPNWDPDGAKTNPSVQASYALSKAAQYGWDARVASQAAQRDLAALRAQVTTLAAAVAAAAKDNVDEQAIIAGVLAGLSPAAIAAAIPASVAQQVVDLLAARMAA